ncbi:MAG: hypothetical protein ACREO3_06160 [Arenimonas sp.]
MKRGALAALAALTLLGGCAKPIPAEDRELVGTWEAPGMRLSITADGSLAYERNKAGGNVSIDAPIQQIRPDGFTAGVGPLTTDFKLERAPHAEQGAWTMTVDGVVLTRRAGTGPAPVEVER